ncbi:hypothetical protein [Sphingobacterium sp.]
MDNSKKLYIIRHAKAETIPGINDFDRALTSVTIYGINVNTSFTLEMLA